MSKVAIVSAGAFGTAIAHVLSELSGKSPENQKCYHDISLHVKEESLFLAMKRSGVNNIYFNKFKLYNKIKLSDQLDISVENADFVIIAIPSRYVEEILLKIKNVIKKECVVVLTSKGFSADGSAVSDLAKKLLPNHKISGLYGIMFAELIAHNEGFSYLTIASEDTDTCKATAHLFNGCNMRIYLSNDIRGAELGGIMKNIYAIFMGLYESYLEARHGNNYKKLNLKHILKASKYSLQSACVMEFINFGLLRKVKMETLIGPSGVGDIYACMNRLSRNFRYGYAVNQKNIQNDHDKDAPYEGLDAIKIALSHSRDLKIEMPILQASYDILFNGKDTEEIIDNLISKLNTISNIDQYQENNQHDPMLMKNYTFKNDKIKILFLSANPLNTSRLRLDEEVRSITTNLKLAKERERLILVQEWAVTPDSLMQAVLDESPDIVHFSGHGEMEGICLEDA